MNKGEENWRVATGDGGDGVFLDSKVSYNLSNWQAKAMSSPCEVPDLQRYWYFKNGTPPEEGYYQKEILGKNFLWQSLR